VRKLKDAELEERVRKLIYAYVDMDRKLSAT
jgi:hypothetical protein